MSIDIETSFNHELLSLLGSESSKNIAVAASGGSDSTALFHLFAKFGKKFGYKVTVIFIDHGTRLEIDHEREIVQNQSLALGHEFVYIKWEDGNKITSHFQEKAREARYNFLISYCKNHNIRVLSTGHHLDDKIENYLFRKERKSGIFGLTAGNIHFREDIRIIRPMHFLYKSEIQEYLKKNNIIWSEDASNSECKYHRNRIRKDLQTYSKKEIHNIVEKIKNNDIQQKKENELYLEAIAETVSFHSGGFAKINLSKFNKYKTVIKLNIILYLTTQVSGRTLLPRYRNIEPILTKIDSNIMINCTIHNCRLISDNVEILIYKEISKIDQGEFRLSNGLLWDNRYRFYVDKSFDDSSNYIVACLSIKALSELKKSEAFLEKYKNFNYYGQKKIIFSFPVIKDLEKVVALPNIGYYNDNILAQCIKSVFVPSYISRFTHFIS